LAAQTYNSAMARVLASLLSGVMFLTLAAVLLAQAPNSRDEARRELDAFQRSGHFAVLVGINQYGGHSRVRHE
jgi:hypothetical protein